MFHVFGRGAVMLDRGAVARNVSRVRFAFEHAFQNLLHAEGEAVRLGHALDLRFAISRAQNSGELSVTVNTGIVHLDGDDAFESRPEFLEAIRQRMNVAEMERADFFALLA